MLDLPAVMEYLGSIGMNQVMVEAGARLNGELLVQDLVDEWIIYQSASLLGPSSRSLVQLPQLERISDRVELQLLDFRQVGKDLRLRYRVDCSTGA
jgi:diaminohydroxyphosphoribosylaminopyrimidine deaminase/5-amino-6-(5-phosphoribosylamino)uracil reductase